MSNATEATIRARAFEIYESEKQGGGHDLCHWFRAEAELSERAGLPATAEAEFSERAGLPATAEAERGERDVLPAASGSGDKVYRGSQKHILDWTSSASFADDFAAMLDPVPCRVSDRLWMPVGHKDPQEVRLEAWGPRALPGLIDWTALTKWWLAEGHGNTPNWDLGIRCTERCFRRKVLMVHLPWRDEGRISAATSAVPPPA
jgi:hypothetical protein